MVEPDWLGGAFRAVFRLRPQDPPDLSVIHQVTERIEKRADDIATAISAISEKLRQ